VSEALEESARLINSDDFALALANIASEWLEMKGVVPLQTTLEDHIEHLERIYGRKLIVSGPIIVEDENDEEDDEEPVAKSKDETDEFEELF